LAATPDGGGYWEVASDGGIFAEGDANFYGSTGAITLNKAIVGMAATPDGLGYWLVAADGGIFSFGDAKFHGSTGAMVLNKAIVGMAATPDGLGYWLVAADGGIFSFGDAKFHGSTGALTLNDPIVGMAPTPDGQGYWEVAADGGIFSWGDAVFHGSTGGMSLVKPIVGMGATLDGLGYWLVAADGGIFSFGDAKFHGSAGGLTLVRPIVGMAVVPSTGTLISPGASAPTTDISCPTTTFCAAVDYGGNVITYSGGAWSAPVSLAPGKGIDSVSCPTATFCMAVSYLAAKYSIFNGTSWSALTTAPPFPSLNFDSVSCTSSTFCGVVGQHGYLYFYKSGVWSAPGGHDGEANTTGGPNAISCTGTFCMSVDNFGNYQTSTDGGGISPLAATGLAGGLASVSCTSTSFCVVGASLSYNVSVWNGSGFTLSGKFVSTANLNLGLNGMSCVGTACTAVDSTSSYTTPDAVTWSAPVPFDPNRSLVAVSCPTTAFCGAVDFSGFAYLINPLA